ncbi:PIR protein [Plasmodium yoelii]|uniref:PIR protein n=2 Tax=Plasmodium yoelii TaxID=5861 RepID=A0AAE9WRE4_PLAYO|nr:PIR protein [Plasmodium yoelii]WBY57666.1 PIR protein [Plasmodium yoelii yoelii]VTZ78684.1 PIR protein [Plasmodium yoelii]|eukprot:XP_022810678.1 PIR protein [Plasmodium yoelii]
MDYTMCMRFDTLRKYLPDELNKSTNLDFKSLGNFMNYCSNGESKGTECKTELDKINAACLWLFEQLILKNKNDINMAEYIIIWLSYMLNLKNDQKINNLNDFYTNYIENNTYYTNCDNGGKNCSDKLQKTTGYTNYKEIIDKKKELLSINLGDMSKFYDAFKSLCNMYTELRAGESNCEKCLENAKEFVKTYDEFNKNSNITKDSPYYQVLSTLSNDYHNFKNYCSMNNVDCSNMPHLSPINIKENGVQSSGKIFEQNGQGFEQISEVPSSSSSITSKLIPVLSIIVAIPIFLGIFYKYSLFGFRKRSQKQHLREKLKK